MSRSIKGAKGPGYEYWGRRPCNGYPPGRWAKTLTHRRERRSNKKDLTGDKNGVRQ
jgi:hypothetical protein